MIGLRTFVGAGVVALSLMGPPLREAAADVRVEKVVAVPDFGAEELYIVNRLGAVAVHGWDRPEVQVRAIKHAADSLLAERLRVQVSRRDVGRLAVVTFARVPTVRSPASREHIRRLLEYQRQALGALIRGDATDEAAALVQSVGVQLAQLRGRVWPDLSQPADLSVPVVRGRLDLVIDAPRQLAIRARTLSHDLEVEDCIGGATLSSENGAIVLHDARGEITTFASRGRQRLIRVSGQVTVEGGSADVELRQVSGAVRAMLSTGSIDARQLSGGLTELKTIGGRIRLAGPLGSSNYRLVSVDGDLVVELPLEASAELDGRAQQWEFGRFHPLRLERSHGTVHAMLGRGGSRLQLNTGMGKVQLVALDGEGR